MTTKQDKNKTPNAKPTDAPSGLTRRVVHGDGLEVLREIASDSIDLIYVDPPFNTGRVQRRDRLKTTRSVEGEGDRTGFAGRRYRTERVSTDAGFNDAFDDYLAFLEPRLREAHRVLKPTGSLYLHIDYREVHYVKVLLDEIFGRESFINEIIWAYDYGARTTKRWPAKHDNILFFAKDPSLYHFDMSEVDRIPYMAPALVGPEKTALGKLPTDTWWHTIVSPTGKEKLGYPTQKPIGILRRIVKVSAPKGGVVLDFFAGSGTTGAAALEHDCSFVLVDESEAAIDTMKRRFASRGDVAFEKRIGRRATDARSAKPQRVASKKRA